MWKKKNKVIPRSQKKEMTHIIGVCELDKSLNLEKVQNKEPDEAKKCCKDKGIDTKLLLIITQCIQMV